MRLVNRSSGDMPSVAVVAARDLTDTLAEILLTAQTRPLDVYAVVAVNSTMTDYLPTSIRRYTAVAEDHRDEATAAFLEQLAALQSSADATLEAIQRQDVDALMTQGNFLRTKFSQSDLVL